MKTTWQLATLFYSSDSDPAIARDMQKMKRAANRFAKKYTHDKAYLRNARALAAALGEYEKVHEVFAWAQPVLYFYLRKDADTGNQKVAARLNQLMTEYTEYQNAILFFELALQTIPKAQQQRLLRNTSLAAWHYFLERVFAATKHALDESAERVLNLMLVPSYEMWVQAQQKMLMQQVITHRNKAYSLPEALNTIKNLPVQQRRSLSKGINKALAAVADIAEAEINAVITHKKITDGLRGYKHPYTERLLRDQVSERTVEILRSLVTDSFSISHRFYALKARMHGLSKLAYYDRSAVMPSKTAQSFTHEETVKLQKEVLGAVDARYLEIFESMVQRGQFDVYPRKGKGGGAYCLSAPRIPTMILLNHTDDATSALTLAHEMGHALHSHFSKTQQPLYVQYSTAVAEVASTFFENLMFDALIERAKPADKVRLLHDHIASAIASVFRQIAFYNFELELHTTIREQGGMSKQDIAQLMNRHMAAYLGPVFELVEDDGYSFAYVSHIRRMFYVYSYAYGELISRSLVQRYKQDPQYIQQVHTFLESGCSASPYDIFKRIGINTNSKAFWQEGLLAIERDIDQLESLIA